MIVQWLIGRRLKVHYSSEYLLRSSSSLCSISSIIGKTKICRGDGGRSSIILRALENRQNKKRGIEESTDKITVYQSVDSLNPCSEFRGQSISLARFVRVPKGICMEESWSIHRKDLTGLPQVIKLVMINKPIYDQICSRKKPVRSVPRRVVVNSSERPDGFAASH